MSEDQTDVSGLMRKNAELLAEVKALKGKLQEAESAREAALQAANEAQAVTRRVALETPLQDALSGRFVVPWRIVRPLLDDHFAFDMGADGGAEIKTKAGEAVALADLPGQLATIPDLAALLHPPRGGGAKGSHTGHDVDDKPKQPDRVASPFALR